MVVFFLSVPKRDVITHQHNIKIAITQSKMKILVKNFRSKCCLSF